MKTLTYNRPLVTFTDGTTALLGIGFMKSTKKNHVEKVGPNNLPYVLNTCNGLCYRTY